LAKLPPALRANPDAKKLAEAADDRSWLIVRLINTRHSHSGTLKDAEFSTTTIEEAWTAGVEDVRRSIAGWHRIQPREVDGVQVYRPTEYMPAETPTTQRVRDALAARP
jgi:NTE family protein